MCSLVCAVTLECIIENQYHSYPSMKRMEHIFSHVYGFNCVRCPTRISIEHDWRHLFRSLKVTTTRLDPKSKDKVILKKVKVGIKGAEEFGEFEEWFNYRLSRAAPETCAEFLGSFVADKTNSQFTKGAKWLVWKFEGDLTLGDYIIDRNFP
ncbi:serine/threonine-protein kinase STN8, chloroplastic [Trifolium repens]|nr:serine/threonine-protein kinase STN8, chloroplastic [Trifolium repens]